MKIGFDQLEIIFPHNDDFLCIWDVYAIQTSVAFHTCKVTEHCPRKNFLILNWLVEVYIYAKPFAPNSNTPLRSSLVFGFHSLMGILFSILLVGKRLRSHFEHIIASPHSSWGRLFAKREVLVLDQCSWINLSAPHCSVGHMRVMIPIWFSSAYKNFVHRTISFHLLYQEEYFELWVWGGSVLFLLCSCTFHVIEEDPA